MPITRFEVLRSANLDPDVRHVQESARAVFDDLAKRSILDGQAITDLTITSGTPLIVQHGLGRKLTGWIVTGKDANANVWDSQSANGMPNRTLILNASANVTISLWVF